MDRRQVCWAHLLRKFISFEEQDGKVGDYGRELLQYTGILFDYWTGFRDGDLSRQELRTWMAPLRKQFEALLQRIVDAQLEELSGSCADVLAHRAALWNFGEHDGVEPTNNHTERELRAFVLDRKTWLFCGHDISAQRAAAALTIITTCKKLGIDPRRYMGDTLRRLVAGEKDLGALLPENYKPHLPDLAVDADHHRAA